ncbi:MAG: hypothetical protein GWM98_06885 [Nitrospinaceae bacterium]|nr:hypothetical protein [Nitrospinaceae bacterium]NIR54270.1 hypothetical protein [Nitrospinaceae bacterium]NIS84687.1 hypothetical protein [Nitrospinaceae bacterium]NIT81482.1 hypothetical protein [Nitrospinaceae bacterium]NIU43766.1 hypothetical protein [Nitrospinaceae bacterium]
MAYKTMVKKIKINTIIRTAGEKIEGNVHCLPNMRLLDLMNHPEESFVPVSDAAVYDEESGKLLYQVPFMAVNKSHVIVISETGQDASPETA